MTRHEASKNKAPVPSLADLIREVARESGLSVYAIAKKAGVDQPNLHRFLKRERNSLTIENAQRLFEVLGLQVVRLKKKSPKPIPKPSEREPGAT